MKNLKPVVGVYTMSYEHDTQMQIGCVSPFPGSGPILVGQIPMCSYMNTLIVKQNMLDPKSANLFTNKLSSAVISLDIPNAVN